MPNSVCWIGDLALNSQKLSDIYFKGTQNEWVNMLGALLPRYKNPNVARHYLTPIPLGLTGTSDNDLLTSVKNKLIEKFDTLTINERNNLIFTPTITVESFAPTEAELQNVADSIEGIKKLTFQDETFTIETPQALNSGTCGAQGNNLTWFLGDDNTLTISGTGDMADYDSATDTPWNQNVSNIQKIVIKEGVKSIGNYAFSECKRLTSITLPSIERIGDYAFNRCTSLKRIDLPASISAQNAIGEDAFKGCTMDIYYDGLKEQWDKACTTPVNESKITLHLEQPDASGECGDNLRWSYKDGTLRISGTGAMTDFEDVAPWDEYWDSIETIELTGDITTIGDYAFDGCSKLTSINLPISVTSIGNQAFNQCNRLPSIDLSHVETIGDKAFNNCSSLTSIALSNVTSIGKQAFNNCNRITRIDLSTNTLVIEAGAFDNCNALTGIYYYNTRDYITFKSTPSATVYYKYDYTFNKSGEGTVNSLEILLDGNRQLVETNTITLVDAIEEPITLYINNRPIAAELDEDDATINFTYTGILASGNCGAEGNNLTWTLNDNNILTISGTGDMADWNSENDVPWIADEKAVGEAINEIVIDKGVTSIGNYAFRKNSNTNDKYSSLTGITFTSPSSVTHIGDYAFAGYSSSITLPSSITSIGDYAFDSCSSLTSINLPNLESIGEMTFSECNNLTSINLPNLTSMGTLVFYKCEKLDTVTLSKIVRIEEAAFSYCTGLTSITLPDSVTSIGDSAFMNCTGLTSITLPVNVSIENYAFDTCSNLQDVYYKGTQEQWNQLEIGTPNFENLTNLIIHYKLIYMFKNIGTGAVNKLEVQIGEGEKQVVTANKITLEEGITEEVTVYINDNTQGITATIEGTTIKFDYTEQSSTETPYRFVNTGTGTVNTLEVQIGNGEKQVVTNDRIALQDPITEGTTVTVFVNGNDEGISARVNGTTITYEYEEPSEFIASGECGAEGDNLTWTLDREGTLTISGTGDMVNFGFSNNQAPWYEYGSLIQDINITEGVTSIGDFAFYNTSNNYGSSPNLPNISLPNSIISIGQFSLTYEGITSIDLPNVTNVGNNAFFRCENLTSINLPLATRIGAYAFRACSNLTTVNIPKVEVLEEYTFAFCSNLSNIMLSTSLSEIKNNVFECCTSLRSMTLPSSVTKIGSSAFSSCSALTNITLPSNVIEIGGSAFISCNSLTSITLPANISTIGNLAFYCALTDVYYEGTETQWNNITKGEKSFKNEAIIHYLGESDEANETTLAIAGTDKAELITAIRTALVAKFDTLSVKNDDLIFTAPASESSFEPTEAELQAVAEEIEGVEAISFSNNTFTITETTQPSDPTDPNDPTNPNDPTDPSNPENQFIIEVDSSQGSQGITITGIQIQDNVTEITIPSEINGVPVVAISDRAFVNNPNIEKVTIAEGVKTIGDGAFKNCSSLTEITLPEGIKTIGINAFKDCPSLTEVTLPSGVETIGANAFENTGLTSFTVPDSVTFIGDGAFANCTNLTTITLPLSLETLSKELFEDCVALEEIRIVRSRDNTSTPLMARRTAIVPVALSARAPGAMLPFNTTLSTIEEDVFKGCMKLRDIYFEGTKAEWDAIEIDPSNTILSQVTIHYLGESNNNMDITKPNDTNQSTSNTNRPNTGTNKPNTSTSGNVISSNNSSKLSNKYPRNEITTSSSRGGSIELNTNYTTKGSTVKVTVIPDDGYKLDELTITDANGKTIPTTKKSGIYTFLMPDTDVMIQATFIIK